VLPAVDTLYKAYKDKVQFVFVYVREAHPSHTATGRATGDRFLRMKTQPKIAQPKTIQERIIVATKCVQNLKIALPTLIDDMDGSFLKKYGGFPAGTAIVDLDGKIVYYNRGPGGCRPREAEKAFKGPLAKQIEASRAKYGPVKPLVPPKPTTAPAKKVSAKTSRQPAPSK